MSEEILEEIREVSEMYPDGIHKTRIIRYYNSFIKDHLIGGAQR